MTQESLSSNNENEGLEKAIDEKYKEAGYIPPQPPVLPFGYVPPEPIPPQVTKTDTDGENDKS